MKTIRHNRLQLTLRTVLLGTALGATISLPALAAEQTSVSAPRTPAGHTLAVNYSDLDLSHPLGREVLEQRLESAAEKVCGSSGYKVAGNLRDASRNRSCQAEAMARALDAVYGARHDLAMVR